MFARLCGSSPRKDMGGNGAFNPSPPRHPTHPPATSFLRSRRLRQLEFAQLEFAGEARGALARGIPRQSRHGLAPGKRGELSGIGGRGLRGALPC
eukprot:scaffold29417_cov51-Phaeocystis_antarctica.AAC.2